MLKILFFNELFENALQDVQHVENTFNVQNTDTCVLFGALIKGKLARKMQRVYTKRIQVTVKVDIVVTNLLQNRTLVSFVLNLEQFTAERKHMFRDLFNVGYILKKESQRNISFNIL